MSANIHRRVPPQRLITVMNPFVRLALRTPFHRLLDNSVLILHVVGRSSGRCYDIPVGFVDVRDRLIVVTQHRWRRNLRSGVDPRVVDTTGTDLGVTRFGRRLVMHAELDEDPVSVAVIVDRVLRRVGRSAGARRLGIVIDGVAEPTSSELAEANREFDLAVISLTAVGAERHRAPSSSRFTAHRPPGHEPTRGLETR